MNFFKNMVGGAPNADEYQNNLTKQGEMITKLKERAKALQLQRDNANKSCEEYKKKVQLLQATTESQNAYLKQNLQYFLSNLQNVPNDIIATLTSSILAKLNEQIGQKIDENSLQSFLDLDFNYRSTFTQHINKVYELTKQKISLDLKKNDSINHLQEKLSNKDKQIEELIDRYQNNQKTMEKDFQMRLNNKIEEFNIVKEQKDIHIRESTDIITKFVGENEQLKKEIAKSKSNENQLKIQKEKIQKKLSEQCQMNNHLLSKNTELDMDVKTITAESEIMMAEIMKQNLELTAGIDTAKKETERLKAQLLRNSEEKNVSSQQFSAALENLKSAEQKLTQCQKTIIAKQEQVKQYGQSNETLCRQLKELKMKEKMLKNKINSINIQALKNELVQISQVLAQFKITFNTDKQQYGNGFQAIILQTMAHFQANEIHEDKKVQQTIEIPEKVDTIPREQHEKITRQLLDIISSKSSQINTLVLNNKEDTSQIQELRKDLQRLNDDYSYLEQQREKFTHSAKRARQELQQEKQKLEEKIIDLQYRLGQALAHKEEAFAANKSLQSSIALLQNENKEYSQQFIKGNEQSSQIREMITKMQERLILITEQNQSNCRLIASKDEKIVQIETNINQLSQRLQEKDQAIKELQEKMTNKCTDLQNIQENANKLEQESQRLNQLLAQLINQQALLKIESKQAKDEFEKQQEKDRKEHKAKLRALQTTIEQREREREESKHEVQRLSQHVKILTETLNSKQGDSNSVQLIEELQAKYKTQIDAQHHTIVTLETTVNSLKVQLEDLKCDKEGLLRQSCHLKEETAVLNDKIINLQTTIAHLTKEFLAKQSEMRVTIEEGKKNYEQLQAKVNFKEKQTEQMQQKLNNIEKNSNEQRKRFEQQLQLRFKEYNEAVKQLQQAQQKKLESKREIEVLKVEKESLLSELNQANTSIQKLRGSITEHEETIQALQKDLSIERAKIKQSSALNQAIKEKYDLLEKNFLESHTDNISLNEKIDALSAELSGKVDQIQLLEQKIKDLNEEIQSEKTGSQKKQQHYSAVQLQADHQRQQIQRLKETLSNELNTKNEELKVLQAQKQAQTSLSNDYANRLRQIAEQKYKLEEIIQQRSGELALTQSAIKDTLESKQRQWLKVEQDLKNQNAKLLSALGQSNSQIQLNKRNINELNEQLLRVNKTNHHLQQRISTQHQQLVECKQQIELGRATSNEMLKNISILRGELDLKVTQYSQLLKENLEEIEKLTNEKRKIKQEKDKEILQNKEEVVRLKTALSSLQADLQQKENEYVQMKNKTEEETLIKDNELRDRNAKIAQLENKLSQQISQKNQALEDQQFMSQLYKDFQARESQMSQKEEKIIELQSYADIFSSIFHKDYNKESILFLKSSIDLLNIELKQQADTMKAKQSQYETEITTVRQQLVQQTTISQHYEQKMAKEAQQKINLQNEIAAKEKQLEEFTKQSKTKELEILNSLNRYEESNEKLKIQLQQFKAKFTKKQAEISKYTQTISTYQQKIQSNKLDMEEKDRQCAAKENLLTQAKKEIQIYKTKMLDENKRKVEEKEYYEKELHRLRMEIEKSIIEGAQQLKKEINLKEESFKAQILQAEKAHKEEIRKCKEALDSAKKEREDLEKELLQIKSGLTEEKKNTARHLAKINQLTNEINKLENQQSNSQQIQLKMQLKDQQIKKCFANIQSLKNTMSDLEEGIQTYQSMAEEKEKEAEQQREKCVHLQQEILNLQNEIDRLERKAKDNRMEHKMERMIDQKPQKVEKRQSSILPLKLLFLKYFQPGISYQAKLRTFNTLCEVLSLQTKEMQQMNQYRRTKLATQFTPVERETLQNKLFNYLSAD